MKNLCISNQNVQNPMLLNSNQNVMNPMMPLSYSNQNIMNPILPYNNPNAINPIGMMNFPQKINNLYTPMGNMNNNMNLMINNNIMNNQNNNMNYNMNNINMNNKMNQNSNNLSQNFNQNMNNMNNNFNQLNANFLINNMDNLNLNSQKKTLYQEKPNYIASEETKLILNNNEISRGKLVSNMKTVSPTLQSEICLDLVMTPVECDNCSKLFCKVCIDNWLKNANECPNKHPFVKKAELDEWVKKELGKIFLKCPYIGCGSDYAYKYWTRHVKKCPIKSNGVKKLNDENDITTDGGDYPFIWNNIQFFVKDIHGNNHTFKLPLSTTVRELKEKLEEKTGFKVEAQRLSCNGKEMDNPKMLEFYGLQENQTITQLARLKGGN